MFELERELNLKGKDFCSNLKGNVFVRIRERFEFQGESVLFELREIRIMERKL